MILSLFIRNKEFHVAWGDFARAYKVNEPREMADSVPMFLKEAIDFVAFEQCNTILYSSGPASFTTARIMTSLIKGIAISRPDLKFVGISNFLTYAHIASQVKDSGMLAIPTMRGDYFVTSYRDGSLTDIKVMNELPTNAFLDDDHVFDVKNLASMQIGAINANTAAINSKYMQTSLDINYGFTPEYRASAS